jgi:arsenate reductase (glutaredoxin)
MRCSVHFGKDEDDLKNQLESEQREYSSPACYLHEFEKQSEDGETLTIYHNPSCSKSRETLALIRASGITPRVIEYLKTPPSEVELAGIVRKLGIAPAELARTSEPVYRDKYLDKQLSDVEWIRALVADPTLMQRPIVVRGDAAVIGRPPENVQRLLAAKDP